MATRSAAMDQQSVPNGAFSFSLTTFLVLLRKFHVLHQTLPLPPPLLERIRALNVGSITTIYRWIELSSAVASGIRYA